jgi:hypothetical protein
MNRCACVEERGHRSVIDTYGKTIELEWLHERHTLPFGHLVFSSKILAFLPRGRSTKQPSNYFTSRTRVDDCQDIPCSVPSKHLPSLLYTYCESLAVLSYLHTSNPPSPSFPHPHPHPLVHLSLPNTPGTRKTPSTYLSYHP